MSRQRYCTGGFETRSYDRNLKGLVVKTAGPFGFCGDGTGTCLVSFTMTIELPRDDAELQRSQDRGQERIADCDLVIA